MNNVEQMPPQPAAVHIPLFALYGEERWPYEMDGMHIEALQTRSRAYEWKIKPHRHPTLYQFVWLSSGTGRFHYDGQENDISGPLLILLPPGVAHGFEWDDMVSGFVLTPSPHFLEMVAPEENRALLDDTVALSVDGAMGEAFDRAFSYLFGEFERRGAGRRAGLTAGILRIVSLIAQVEAVAGEGRYLSAEAELIKRFRKLVEVNFWKHRKLEDYCSELGVTTSRLSRACRMAVGKSPLTLIHERILVAAKRKLTYTTLSISEVGFELGFDDPAYFSRFFSKHSGASPVEFRTNHRCAILLEQNECPLLK